MIKSLRTITKRDHDFVCKMVEGDILGQFVQNHISCTTCLKIPTCIGQQVKCIDIVWTYFVVAK